MVDPASIGTTAAARGRRFPGYNGSWKAAEAAAPPATLERVEGEQRVVAVIDGTAEDISLT